MGMEKAVFGRGKSAGVLCKAERTSLGTAIAIGGLERRDESMEERRER